MRVRPTKPVTSRQRSPSPARGRDRFPLLKGDRDAIPATARCAWCKRRKVGEPFEFVLFSGGALVTKPHLIGAVGDVPLDAWLGAWWHGAHPLTCERIHGKPIISMENPEARVDIAEDVKFGQF